MAWSGDKQKKIFRLFCGLLVNDIFGNCFFLHYNSIYRVKPSTTVQYLAQWTQCTDLCYEYCLKKEATVVSCYPFLHCQKFPLNPTVLMVQINTWGYWRVVKSARFRCEWLCFKQLGDRKKEVFFRRGNIFVAHLWFSYCCIKSFICFLSFLAPHIYRLKSYFILLRLHIVCLVMAVVISWRLSSLSTEYEIKVLLW